MVVARPPPLERVLGDVGGVFRGSGLLVARLGTVVGAIVRGCSGGILRLGSNVFARSLASLFALAVVLARKTKFCIS